MWQRHMARKRWAIASVALIKSASQTLLRSVLGKQGDQSAHPVHVKSMSQKHADTEKSGQRRHDLSHDFAVWLEMPGRAARSNW
jgi:hypothetical protein